MKVLSILSHNGGLLLLFLGLVLLVFLQLATLAVLGVERLNGSGVDRSHEVGDRIDDVFPVHLNQMHGCEKAANVVLDVTWDQIHEVHQDELGQLTIPQVDERVQGVNGHRRRIHDLENSSRDATRDTGQDMIGKRVRTIRFATREILGNFEAKLATLDLLGNRIIS